MHRHKKQAPKKEFDNLEDAIKYTKNTIQKNNYGGRCFGLVMSEESEFISYIVPNQPCWGGLRKYKTDSNGDRSTKPELKPTDLYYEFPNGTVEYLITKQSTFSKEMVDLEFQELLLSKDSPWIRGFNPEKTFLEQENKQMYLEFFDTDIDPAVLVSLLSVIYNQSMYTNYGFYRRLGLDKKRSLFCSVFVGTIHKNFSGWCAYQPDYYFSKTVDVKRFLKGESKDLTGGSWKKGYDYDRKNLNLLFKSDKGINISKHMMKKIKESKINKAQDTLPILIDSLKELDIDKHFEERKAS